MRRVFFAALLLFPLTAWADHIDVIEFTMNEGCSQQEYLAIVDEFNEDWGKEHGYRTEILFPIQSEDAVTLFWAGRSENAAAFGAAFDAWTSAQGDPESLAFQLMERFNKCSTVVGRRGYFTH